MKITAIYGSEKKGSTHAIAQQFIHSIGGETASVQEFYLPRDMPHFCIGCYNCFSKGEQFCPHAGYVSPIATAIENADLVLFTTPVYALRVTAQLKALLDHLAYQFMVHRPNEKMFSKTALVISTAAGGGTKSAMKDITTSLRFWGMAKTFTFGANVYASDWKGVKEQSKEKIAKQVQAVSKKIQRTIGHARPGVIVKVLFYALRSMQSKSSTSTVDANHWREKGWLDKQRPWRKSTG